MNFCISETYTLDNITMNLYSQYCEYYPDYANCKKWMEENMPDRLEVGTKLRAVRGKLDEFWAHIAFFCLA